MAVGEKKFYSFSHPLHKHVVLANYIPGIVSGTDDTSVGKKKINIPAMMEHPFELGKTDNN